MTIKILTSDFELIIDYRERDLINKLCGSTINETGSVNFSKWLITSGNLAIGDLQFSWIIKNAIDNKRIAKYNLICERKTLEDLAGSISSGRYHEQKLRLLNSEKSEPDEIRRIFYFIEGALPTGEWSTKIPYNRLTYNGLVSSMITNMVCDNIHVLRMLNTDELSKWSSQFMLKIEKSSHEWISPELINLSKPQTPITETTNEKITDETSLITDTLDETHAKLLTMSRIKRENVDPNMCYRMMLMQIPGVSASIAGCIIEKYTSIGVLIDFIRENYNKNVKCLNDITYLQKTDGKSRRIGKIGETICKMLLNSSS